MEWIDKQNMGQSESTKDILSCLYAEYIIKTQVKNITVWINF